MQQVENASKSLFVHRLLTKLQIWLALRGMADKRVVFIIDRVVERKHMLFLLFIDVVMLLLLLLLFLCSCFRTCEIFAVEELILPSLSVTRTDEFKGMGRVSYR